MKKLMALLLVVVLCLSMLACGGESGAKEPVDKQTVANDAQQETEKTIEAVTEPVGPAAPAEPNDPASEADNFIEITTENWQDYLEYKSLEVWKDGNAQLIGCLCLKEEYAVKVDPTISTWEFEWTANEVQKSCQYDVDNRILTLGETIQVYHEIPAQYACLVSADKVADTPYAENHAITILYYGVGDMSTYMNVLEDFKIVESKGKIVFE